MDKLVLNFLLLGAVVGFCIFIITRIITKRKWHGQVISDKKPSDVPLGIFDVIRYYQIEEHEPRYIFHLRKDKKIFWLVLSINIFKEEAKNAERILKIKQGSNGKLFSELNIDPKWPRFLSHNDT